MYKTANEAIEDYIKSVKRVTKQVSTKAKAKRYLAMAGVIEFDRRGRVKLADRFRK